MKLSARDAALTTVSAAIGAGLVFLIRLPKVPDENNMLALAGALIGPALAGITGIIVVARQFSMADERNLRTVRSLFRALKVSGEALLAPDASLNPSPPILHAKLLFLAAKQVTAELRATSGRIALAASMFDDDTLHQRLMHLSQPGLGIAPPDLTNLGNEIADLASAGLDALSP